MTTSQKNLERRWTALILLCVAEFIVVLDASIVNVALPSIGKGLHFSDQNLPWVVNAYLIAFGGFLLLGGRAADLVGRRRVFMAGLLTVGIASLAAGFATTQAEPIAARAAQGLGAAMISPAALSIITNLFKDGAERNRALAAWGAVVGTAGAAGVLLGGILTDSLGWEWVLWVNVPVAAIALALTPGLIVESRSESATRHFDAAGAISVTAGLSVLVYACLDAGSSGWGSTKIVTLLARRRRRRDTRPDPDPRQQGAPRDGKRTGGHRRSLGMNGRAASGSRARSLAGASILIPARAAQTGSFA